MANRPRWVTPILLLVLLALPLSLFLLINFGAEQQFDRVPTEYDIVNGDTVVHTLPIFSLRTLDGDTLTQADFLGKITFFDFFALGVDDSFTRVQTLVLHGNLKRTYDNVEWQLDPPIQFVSINTGNSLEAVKAYAAEREVDPTYWPVLVGDSADIMALAKATFHLPAFNGRTAADLPFTAQTIAMVDKVGTIRKYYVATNLIEERKIQEDLITLLRLEYPEDLKKIRQARD
jgi:hypothetical protein